MEMELEEVEKSMIKMASNMMILDHMLGVEKRPSDKKGLSYIDDKEASSLSKMTFVKSIDIKEPLSSQHPRKKIDLGGCSRSAQVKVAPKGQAQGSLG